MHTPDGFLTGWICVVTLIISLGFIGYSFFSARKWLTREKALIMAGLASAIFAFQMLNFPIGNGTSGHLIGGAIAAIIVGPQAAIIVLSTVLIVQAFVFGDGGVMAIGANILLMGIISVYSAHFIYSRMKGYGKVFAGSCASFVSVISASVSAGVLIGISGTIPISEVVSSMFLTHLFIGLGEGLITSGILLYVASTKSEILSRESSGYKAISRYVLTSVIGAFFIMALALPFASNSPDGMESVAISLGFYDNALEIYSVSPMHGYTLFGSENIFLVISSGAIGMIFSFMLIYGVSSLLRRIEPIPR